MVTWVSGASMFPKRKMGGFARNRSSESKTSIFTKVSGAVSFYINISILFIMIQRNPKKIQKKRNKHRFGMVGRPAGFI